MKDLKAKLEKAKKDLRMLERGAIRDKNKGLLEIYINIYDVIKILTK